MNALGKTKIPDQKWKDLLDHFNQPRFVLVNDNFEFPDLLGAAYEYLIKYFADSAGKKGGEFYTPFEVVRLLVQHVKPQAGNTIYDPTVGSSGFLIQAHELNFLNRIVTAYLEIAEIQALNHNPMTMQDWIERLHQFLSMTGRELLTHAGKISHETALNKTNVSQIGKGGF